MSVGERREIVAQVGDRVAWTSSTTGRQHEGRIVHGDNGLGKVLVRPDEPWMRWTAWEPIADMAVTGRHSA